MPDAMFPRTHTQATRDIGHHTDARELNYFSHTRHSPPGDGGLQLFTNYYFQDACEHGGVRSHR